MSTLDLNKMGLQELSSTEVVEVEGGIFPIVIAGVVISGKTAAWIAAGSIFAAGVYAGLTE
ncbi:MULTISPECIES: class IIb bacteriocin, lactobin A/cerein 7B family [Sphingobacterium]|uniref:class IIb bacteriocin, lactobin A/cerein 7B family n=1 Tax=Sphingobacterium TaxID=28453 RepID=UPI0013DD465E|nr:MULTISPECIES: class IIb bacteriocin, lactobin A/cerein 7B family [unclassified Sphingobacterium]